jgi:hypothetical protein
MMNRIFLTLFLIVSDVYAWTSIQGGDPALNLNPLRFSNRARCAADSKKPTDTAFMLINNVDPGKAIYRLAKLRGEDASSMTRNGIKVFRKSVIEMTQLIHHRLMNRELPLLVENVSRRKLHVPSKYKRIISSCKKEEYCHALDEYVEKLWNIGGRSDLSLGAKRRKFYKVDNFHSKESFLPKKILENKKIGRPPLKCSYLKKFGPLQAHLYGTKPTKTVFEEMAKSLLKSDEYLADCYDFEEQENLEVASFQLEIPNLKDRKWKRFGFDYWNSLKTYLSWAYRNASEMEYMAAPFQDVFRGVALEDNVLFTPNGCRSISIPECSGDYLAQNALREFAKKDFSKNLSKLDVMSEVPAGPQEGLLTDRIPNVNLDELDLGKFQNAEAWMKNFKDNFSKSRTYVKRKLISSLSLLNILKAKISPEKLKADLNKQYFSKINKQSISDSERQQLYYLCAEYFFADHETYSFLKNKLNILKDSKLIDDISHGISVEKAKNLYDYYANVSGFITKSCADLRQKEVWDDTFELKKEGYSDWYIQKVYERKIKSNYGDSLETYLKDKKPYVSYGKYAQSNSIDDVVCAHPSDCARQLLGSIIQLYRATEYAETFFSLKQKVKSPSLFNPYAERVACKIYDPWFKTKSILFNLMWDVGQAALSTSVPALLYTKASLVPHTVTSFNQMVEEGRILYDANFEKQKIINAVAADFGPLLGVPCAVSINTSIHKIYDAYRFVGVSVGACNEKEEYDLNVRSGSDIDDNQAQGHSECLSCQLNFEGVSASLAYATQNIGPSFFLFRGLVRLFKSLKDPFNIPRTWKANPRYVLETYRKFGGEIPKRCVRRLRKGKRCLQSSCEEQIAEEISNVLPGQVLKIEMDGYDTARVWTSKCDGPAEVEVNSDDDHYGDNSNCRSIERIVRKPKCQEVR